MLQVVWFYINWSKYWREKSHILVGVGHTAYDFGRLGGRVKIDCVWHATLGVGREDQLRMTWGALGGASYTKSYALTRMLMIIFFHINWK